MGAWTKSGTASSGSLERSMDAYLVSSTFPSSLSFQTSLRLPQSAYPAFSYYVLAFHARYLTSIFPAINYRLSPQYPFPCAIQDALAAYLYLIRPPSEAKHKPVKPQHIVIMGDSAGGGLALATLQVIRDSGLPQCAGGVLISPWCDLSHSFPSIHGNTATVRPSHATLLANDVLNLIHRTLYLIMVCRCISLVSCGHLPPMWNQMVSVRGSDLVSGKLPGSTTKAG